MREFSPAGDLPFKEFAGRLKKFQGIQKKLKLDAVIEFKVDAEKLVDRIVRRAEEAKAAPVPAGLYQPVQMD